MRPVQVDPSGLADLARDLRETSRRLVAETVAVPAAAAALGPGAPGAALRVLSARRDALAARVEALARTVAVVAESYAATERQVAVLVGGAASARQAVAGVEGLVAGLDPARLEALLVASPGLARLLVDGSAPVPLTDAEVLALPPRERRLLSLLHPERVTGCLAAPVQDRYAASRVLAAAEVSRARERRRGLSGDAAARLDRRLGWLEALLHEDVVLRHPDGTVTRHPHQLLSFDPRGDGRAVEVLGDLGAARHLTVFVPGTGSDLERFPGSVARMAPFAAAATGLAVVTWVGADLPDQPFDDGPPRRVGDLGRAWSREHVIAAAYRDAADTAGPALRDFVDGLRLAAPGAGADTTLVGHSYGGSVVGSAEAHGLRVERVLHLASAGAYVADPSTYAGGPWGTHRFSMTAPDDPIQLSQGGSAADLATRLGPMLPAPLDPLGPVVAPVLRHLVDHPERIGHGLDPDTVPGTTRLDTGTDAAGHLVLGHSGMFTPGTTAWRNVLGVMTDGTVEVLEPARWSVHLEPAGVTVDPPGTGYGGQHLGLHPPHYVVDRSPYDDPAYRPPAVSLSDGVDAAAEAAPHRRTR